MAKRITTDDDGNTITHGPTLVKRTRALLHPAMFKHLIDQPTSDPDTPPPSATLPIFMINMTYPNNKITPFLISHSSDDTCVSSRYGEQAWNILEKMGLKVRYLLNATGATTPLRLGPRGLDDICQFIEDNLPEDLEPSEEVRAEATYTAQTEHERLMNLWQKGKDPVDSGQPGRPETEFERGLREFRQALGLGQDDEAASNDTGRHIRLIQLDKLRQCEDHLREQGLWHDEQADSNPVDKQHRLKRSLQQPDPHEGAEPERGISSSAQQTGQSGQISPTLAEKVAHYQRFCLHTPLQGARASETTRQAEQTDPRLEEEHSGLRKLIREEFEDGLLRTRQAIREEVASAKETLRDDINFGCSWLDQAAERAIDAIDTRMDWTPWGPRAIGDVRRCRVPKYADDQRDGLTWQTWEVWRQLPEKPGSRPLGSWPVPRKSSPSYSPPTPPGSSHMQSSSSPKQPSSSPKQPSSSSMQRSSSPMKRSSSSPGLPPPGSPPSSQPPDSLSMPPPPRPRLRPLMPRPDSPPLPPPPGPTGLQTPGSQESPVPPSPRPRPIMPPSDVPPMPPPPGPPGLQLPGLQAPGSASFEPSPAARPGS